MKYYFISKLSLLAEQSKPFSIPLPPAQRTIMLLQKEKTES